MPKIFKTLDKLEVVYDWTYKIVMFICKILLIADIAITVLSVLGRYVSFIPAPAWGEQMVLTFMVYMAVLSAALGIRRGAHIRMTALDNKLPKKLIKVLDIVADVAVLVLAVIMIQTGLNICNSPLAKFGKYESIPTLSRVWMYLPVPVAGVSMILFEIEAIYRHIKAFFVQEEPAKEVQ
ncbi:MAG: TRAP transporter small permease [Clostridia bacterium]|nr:TRAP transporter small permease [Clostridia bacterium]